MQLGNGLRDDAATSRATSRHVQRLEAGLRGVADLDHLSRTTLEHLVTLPGVARAGLALSEGAGRRLRFVSSDRLGEPSLAWCHIDAYDDVPLTTVTRTGETFLAGLDDLGDRYAELVAQERKHGTCALAALPIPGAPSAAGGFILYFASPQPFDAEQRAALETAAGRIAEAIRRVLSATQAPAHDPSSFAADGTHQASLALEADPRAAGAARRFLREKLTEWDIDESTVDAAQLCVSELVNNVIMHARTTSRLTVSLEELQLTVMLRDLGGAAASGQVHRHEPVTDADEFRVFGRGLTLVDALADDWGSHRDEIGTTAWFVFRIGPDREAASRRG